ncbi:MAG TPA: heparan-alpha-glucosaminide N-acetyltransferase domain-containing protein, partial [Puia sp.]|nr:heparan-alpha-glucosaminide N-acetyltransferase domain-containing protein [Puia sp.]
MTEIRDRPRGIPRRPGTRVQSVDLLRGVALVVMAIDHVRVYSGIPAGGPSPGIFFTRWVTNFCAPAFVFLAGTSAFLYGQKQAGQKQAGGGTPADKGKLARYLVTRGLLLVLLELTVIRFFWMFNFDYANFTLAGVIWMLGWCMVLLAAFVRLQPAVIGMTGLAIILFQQAFKYLPLIFPGGWRKPFGWFWEFFYPSGLDSLPGISILYVLVPWIGVMMAGYGFGQLLTRDPALVRKICLRIGLTAIA